jgi:hypothetical protein
VAKVRLDHVVRASSEGGNLRLVELSRAWPGDHKRTQIGRSNLMVETHRSTSAH